MGCCLYTMTSDLIASKNELRQQLRARLKLLSPEHRCQASRQACDLLQQQPLWQQARSILFYWPIGNELDISPLLHESLSRGKTVALPRFMTDSQTYTAFQIK